MIEFFFFSFVRMRTGLREGSMWDHGGGSARLGMVTNEAAGLHLRSVSFQTLFTVDPIRRSERRDNTFVFL